MKRENSYDILPEILERYAVKNFSDKSVSREEVLPVIDAARFAPSCYNEQPWRFIIGSAGEKSHDKLASTLLDGNAWAKKAPILILLLAKRTFTLNGKPNAFSRFDTGTASGFLQLEAIHQGFVAHSMAGFDADKARELFQIPQDMDITSMIALGRPADLDTLPEELRKQEVPGTRNPLESLLIN